MRDDKYDCRRLGVSCMHVGAIATAKLHICEGFGGANQPSLKPYMDERINYTMWESRSGTLDSPVYI